MHADMENITKGVKAHDLISVVVLVDDDSARHNHF
jgi:hypothetical protein